MSKNVVDTQDNKMTVEQAFELLEEKLNRLEEDDISLEESFAVYKEGMDLVQYCSENINEIEQKVLKMNEDGELDEFF